MLEPLRNAGWHLLASRRELREDAQPEGDPLGFPRHFGSEDLVGLMRLDSLDTLDLRTWSVNSLFLAL